MRAIRFSRLVLGALGSTVVFTLALTSPGCGGGVSDQPGAAVPKERLTVTAKDSMAEYLKSQAQPHTRQTRKR